MTFNWAGGILSGGSTYKLKIVQITGNQSPVIAFETNRAFFEKEDLRIPSFQYPISGSKFLNGKKYAWGVTTESGHSEVSFFIFPGNNNIISNNFESMIHYKKACESEERYFCVEDENMFLFDLNKAFEEVGNVENDV